jgi:hypothetical protein
MRVMSPVLGADLDLDSDSKRWLMMYSFKYNNEINRLCTEESGDFGGHLGLGQVVDLHSLLHTHFYEIVSKVFHIIVKSPRRQEGRGARWMRIRSKRKEREDVPNRAKTRAGVPRASRMSTGRSGFAFLSAG